MGSRACIAFVLCISIIAICSSGVSALLVCRDGNVRMGRIIPPGGGRTAAGGIMAGGGNTKGWIPGGGTVGGVDCSIPGPTNSKNPWKTSSGPLVMENISFGWPNTTEIGPWSCKS